VQAKVEGILRIELPVISPFKREMTESFVIFPVHRKGSEHFILSGSIDSTSGRHCWGRLKTSNVFTVLMRYIAVFHMLSWLRIFRLTFLLLTLAAVRVNSLTLSITPEIQIKAAPLIRGPPWLPLHCQVIVDTTYVFDFVPLDATNTTTLQKLISLQVVPAIARIRRRRQEQTSTTDDHDTKPMSSSRVDRAVSFCRHYNKDLHLIQNNCWTFAYDLVAHITMQKNED
jgi:hypothetical protein